MDSSCNWLFDTRLYQQWYNEPNSKNKEAYGSPAFLWIKGKPGAGKSTLVKEAVRRAKNRAYSEGIVVINYFFTARGNVQLQKTPLGLFRTILYDLLQQDNAVLRAFVSIYQIKKAAMGKNNWQWYQEELQEFFRSVYLRKEAPVRTTYVFIDALDECQEDGYNSVRTLVYFLRELTIKSELQVCISSRHYPHIKVPDCPQIYVERNNSPDIYTYVKSRLSLSGGDERGNNLVQKVTEKANGVFLWVVLVVKKLGADLDNEKTERDLLETLRKVPKKLEELFQSLFGDIELDAERVKAVSLIQWVLLAARPLTVKEIRHAIAFDPANGFTSISAWISSQDCLPIDPQRFETSVQSYSRGLIEVMHQDMLIAKPKTRDSGMEFQQVSAGTNKAGLLNYSRLPRPTPDSQIQFIHESVREFFLKNQGFQIIEDCKNPYTIEERHCILVETCTRYICLEELNFTYDFQPRSLDDSVALVSNL
jgi:hypothetical protein